MADASPGKLSPEQKRGVFVVWLIIFIDLLGFGIVLPSLPYFVRIFEVPEWANVAARAVGLERSRGGVLVGTILTAYSLCQFIFAPIWGRLSDKVGRRPILAFSTSGFAATWVLFAFAPGFTWLLISRALAGVCAANISTAQAYMADVFPAERRSKGMGLIGMAFGLGFVFGPAIGGALVSETLLGWFGYGPEIDAAAFHRAQLMFPSLFAAGLSLTAFVLTVTIMRESRWGLSPKGTVPVVNRQRNTGNGDSPQKRGQSPGGFTAYSSSEASWAAASPGRPCGLFTRVESSGAWSVSSRSSSSSSSTSSSGLLSSRRAVSLRCCTSRSMITRAVSLPSSVRLTL